MDRSLTPERSWAEGGARPLAFARYLSAYTLSIFGAELIHSALLLYAATVLHASGSALGWFSAASQIPYALSLTAGFLADRYSRRAILIASDLCRAALALGIGATMLFMPAPIVLLVSVAFLLACFTLGYEITASAFLPEIVPRSRLTSANGALFSAHSGGTAVATFVVGFLLVALGSGGLLLSIAAIFIAAVALLAWAVRGSHRADNDQPLRISWRGILAGLSILREHRALARLTVYAAFVSMLTSFALVATLVFLDRVASLSPGSIGILLGLPSVGGIAAALLIKPVRRALSFAATLRWAGVLGPLGWLIVALSPARYPTVAGVGLLIVGVATAVYNVSAVSYRQATCPGELQGRLAGALKLCAWGGMPIGAALGGWLTDELGARTVLQVTFVCLMCCFPLLLSASRLAAQGSESV